MTRESLLAALAGRIGRALRSNDAAPVLDPRALEEAAALTAIAYAPAAQRSQAPDLEVLHVVGWLHWLRYGALPEGRDQDDLHAAVTLLAPVFAADRTAVPEELHEVFLQPGPASAAGVGDHGVAGLSEAVAAARANLDALAEGDPARPSAWNNLAVDLRKLFQRTGARPILAEAVAATRIAVGDARRSDRNLPLYLCNLCIGLQLTYDTTGDPGALSEALDAGRAAVAAAPAGHPARAGCLSTLSLALFSQYQRSGDPDVLTEALGAARSGVAGTPEDDPARFADLSGLALILQMRYVHTGDRAMLAEALETCRAALDATPAGHPGRPGQLSNLCAVLQSAYQADGAVAALTEAVAVGRAAVLATPADHPDRHRFLNNLGNALRTMFGHSGDLDALTEAAAIQRAAVAATAEDHAERVGRLTNLCGTLARLAERTGDARLLQEAVASARAAVAAAAMDHPNRTGYIANLCGVLNEQTRQTGALPPVREALSLGRAAMAATPQGHPDRATGLTNLFASLRLEFERTADAAILAEALDTARAASAALPRDHPEWAGNESNLGLMLYTAFKQTGDRDFLDRARDALARAAACESAPVASRVMAGRARALADTEAGDDPAALAAIGQVVGLLPRLAARDLRRADREYRLGQTAGIAAQAAAAALSAGRPHLAVELLEQARGLLLAETMGSRGESDALRRHAPDLVGEFERLRDRLTALEAGRASSPPTDLLPGPDAAAGPDADPRRQHDSLRPGDRMREAGEQWQELVARIRRRPGLSGFLAPLPVRELQERVGRGPIVLVNTAATRCDALVLTTDPHAPVRHIPLPGLTHEDVSRQADRFRRARRAATRDVGPRAIRTARDDLLDILAWLWDTTTGPILDAMGLTEPPRPGRPWPHVWWCPVGTVAYLPLHAAGRHREAATGPARPRTVLDRVVSSYTSTIRALTYVRPGPADVRERAALVVAMPKTPGAAALPGVADERDMLMRLVPGSTLLEGPTARRETVLEALHRHGIAHFACHGLSDWSDPAANRLLLHDHADNPLTVEAISREHLTGAGLAYLSACSTTDTSPQLADEAIHITSAFQLAGYRNVIGTLWPIDDAAATRIATDVYTRLTGDGSRPPRVDDASLALHHALRSLRADHIDEPSLWASHIHTGS